MRTLCRSCLLVLILLHPVVTVGNEHPACTRPFASLPDASAEALREVASSCSDSSTAMLFYNRAYHATTIEHLRRFSQLETRGGSEDGVRYQQGRIFIALAEELARFSWRVGDQGVIDALNTAYDRSIETLEYTIKGYNLLIGGPGDEDLDPVRLQFR